MNERLKRSKCDYYKGNTTLGRRGDCSVCVEEKKHNNCDYELKDYLLKIAKCYVEGKRIEATEYFPVCST